MAFINRLEQATARIRRAARAAASPPAPPERWEAHAADAFAGLCAGPTDSKRSDRSELVIVCDLSAWRRGHTHPGEACHIIGGGPLPVDLARQLGKDAFLKAVLHDGVAIHTVSTSAATTPSSCAPPSTWARCRSSADASAPNAARAGDCSTTTSTPSATKAPPATTTFKPSAGPTTTPKPNRTDKPGSSAPDPGATLPSPHDLAARTLMP